MMDTGNIVYPAISYCMKMVDDGTVVRYNYRWNGSGKDLTKEEVKKIETAIKRKRNKRHN